MYDKRKDNYAKEAIDTLKVLVYRFCYCCKNKNEIVDSRTLDATESGKINS